MKEPISIRSAQPARPAKLRFAAPGSGAFPRPALPLASLLLACSLARAARSQEDPAPASAGEGPNAGSGGAGAAGEASSAASADAPESAPAAASSTAPTDATADASENAAAPSEPAEATEPEAEAEGEAVVVSSGTGLFENGPATESGALEAKVGDSTFELGGYTRGDVFVGIIPGTGQAGINAAYGELSLQATAKQGTWGGAFADFRMRYGQQLSENDLFLDLREAYVNAYLGPLDLRVGKQIVVWGRADAFNPTSNITPNDFRIRSPMEDDRRVGNVGARAFLNFLPLRIEAIWMPLYVPTVYPDVPIDPVVTFTEPDYPSLSIQTGLWAGRVHIELPSFEASASYLYGEALLPGFALAPDGITVGDDPTTAETEMIPPEVRVTRTSYNHHVIGGDFSTAIGDLFGLRGEAAFRAPVNQASKPWTPKPDLQWVLGIDREFGDVMIIAQYMGRYVLNWEPKRNTNGQGSSALCCVSVEQAAGPVNDIIWNSNQMLFSQLHELQSLASLRVEWKTLHDKLSLSALGLVNFNTTEWALMPKVGYQITGALSAYVGGEIFVGPDGTLFNMVEESLSSGYMELRYTF